MDGVRVERATQASRIFMIALVPALLALASLPWCGGTGQMRLIDMSFGPAGEGECYVSAMPGAAGGIVANINRWRGQVGQPSLTEEEIDKLPRKMFLGAPAHFVSADGDFKNVGEETPRSGYRLLGLIHQAPDLTLFVKMTGPQALVEQNTAAFEAFCQSVQFRRKSDKIPTH